MTNTMPNVIIPTVQNLSFDNLFFSSTEPTGRPKCSALALQQLQRSDLRLQGRFRTEPIASEHVETEKNHISPCTKTLLEKSCCALLVLCSSHAWRWVLAQCMDPHFIFTYSLSFSPQIRIQKYQQIANKVTMVCITHKKKDKIMQIYILLI